MSYKIAAKLHNVYDALSFSRELQKFQSGERATFSLARLSHRV